MNDESTHHDHGVTSGPLPLLVLADLGGPLGPHGDLVRVLSQHFHVILSLTFKH